MPEEIDKVRLRNEKCGRGSMSDMIRLGFAEESACHGVTQSETGAVDIEARFRCDVFECSGSIERDVLVQFAVVNENEGAGVMEALYRRCVFVSLVHTCLYIDQTNACPYADRPCGSHFNRAGDQI